MRVNFLLDRSGSMAAKWGETIAALNAYVKALADNPETADTKVRVDAFDWEPVAGTVIETLRRKVTAATYVAIDAKEISPRGGTPLFDAIRDLHARITEKNHDRVTVVILTDGQELHSTRTSQVEAKAFLDALRGRGYDVVFLGADFDAIQQGTALGASAGDVLNMTKGSYAKGARSLATRSMAYASTGFAAAFTEADKAAAEGKA